MSVPDANMGAMRERRDHSDTGASAQDLRNWDIHSEEHKRLEARIERDRLNLDLETQRLASHVLANVEQYRVNHAEVHHALERVRKSDEEKVTARSERENQVREQLREQAGTFVAKDTFDRATQDLRDRLDASAANLSESIAALSRVLTERVSQLELKQSASASLEGRVTQIADQVSLIQRAQSTSSGKGLGSEKAVFYFLSAMGLIIGIMGILLHFVKP